MKQRTPELLELRAIRHVNRGSRSCDPQNLCCRTQQTPAFESTPSILIRCWNSTSVDGCALPEGSYTGSVARKLLWESKLLHSAIYPQDLLVILT